MLHTTNENWLDSVVETVNSNEGISVAIDKQLTCIALNDTACQYLKIRPTDLLGKIAIEVYPEIIASRNHRNILRAMSGIHIPSDLVESRMGDILESSYTPVVVDREVKAVILNARMHLPAKR
jgi:hypothetical protein